MHNHREYNTTYAIKIQTLSAKGVDDANQRVHLLLHTALGVYILTPVADMAADAPLIRFIPGGSIDYMQFCARC